MPRATHLSFLKTRLLPRGAAPDRGTLLNKFPQIRPPANFRPGTRSTNWERGTIDRDAGRHIRPRRRGSRRKPSLHAAARSASTNSSAVDAEHLSGRDAAIQFMPTVMIVLDVGRKSPTLELRRVLAEARAASSKPFVIEYDKLPGTVGDERWREAVESTVRLSDNGRGEPELPHPRRGSVFWKGKVCGRRAGIARAGRMARQNPDLFPLAGARGPRRARRVLTSVHTQCRGCGYDFLMRVWFTRSRASGGKPPALRPERDGRGA